MQDPALPAPEEPQVEIHKPKPWRGWLKEYAVIVIGVLTALAAQQAADWLRWRDEVAQAKAVIATELVSNLTGAIDRVRTKACAERRLAELGQILDTASKTGALPPVGDIGLPPRTLLPRGAWDSVVASQTATHFPRLQLASMAANYKIIERIEQFSFPEFAAWHSLYAMVGPGRRLDPASEADLRQALSQALAYSRGASSLSMQLITRVRDQHLPVAHDDLEGTATAEKQDPNRFEICQPLGAAPSSYGHAYTSPTILAVEAFADKLPNFSGGAR